MWMEGITDVFRRYAFWVIAVPRCLFTTDPDASLRAAQDKKQVPSGITTLLLGLLAAYTIQYGMMLALEVRSLPEMVSRVGSLHVEAEHRRWLVAGLVWFALLALAFAALTGWLASYLTWIPRAAASRVLMYAIGWAAFIASMPFVIILVQTSYGRTPRFATGIAAGAFTWIALLVAFAPALAWFLRNARFRRIRNGNHPLILPSITGAFLLGFAFVWIMFRLTQVAVLAANQAFDEFSQTRIDWVANRLKEFDRGRVLTLSTLVCTREAVNDTDSVRTVDCFGEIAAGGLSIELPTGAATIVETVRGDGYRWAGRHPKSSVSGSREIRVILGPSRADLQRGTGGGISVARGERAAIWMRAPLHLACTVHNLQFDFERSEATFALMVVAVAKDFGISVADGVWDGRLAFWKVLDRKSQESERQRLEQEWIRSKEPYVIGDLLRPTLRLRGMCQDYATWPETWWRSQ
jgi:MFS family permease